MQVSVNGETEPLEEGCTVAGLVGHRGLPPTGVAVAVNGEVVPAGRWHGTPLAPGDRVEIVTARQGG
jgi:sulfur carrier protein